MNRLIPIGLLALLIGCENRETEAVHVDEGACVRCHGDVYAGSAFDHASVGFDQNCASCHVETTWEPTFRFDHDTVFPLGPHKGVDCQACHGTAEVPGCVSCHAGDRDQATPSHEGLPDDCTRCHTLSSWTPSTFEHGPSTTDCATCHDLDRDRANPDHATFGDACAVCHTTEAWRPATFEGHDEVFPLVGVHQTTACESCHVGGLFRGTARQCNGCHADDRATAEPDHTTFPLTCESCHTPAGWSPAAFDHSTWPLTGKHATAACGGCHQNGVYAGTARECRACHEVGTNPDHGGFPTTCESCHTTAAWSPAAFDHSTWPLTGKHATAACGGCHQDGVYAGTTRECRACHEVGTNPDHGGFPTACESCHTTAAWSPADFDHSVWPLVGQHATAACADCHGGGVYEGTDTACLSCHADDRSSATPSHTTFPTDCSGCHTPTGWSPYTYSHRFGVPHRGISTCTQCHTTAGDFSIFACVPCHSQASTNAEHRGVSGYAYESARCYSCHPRGRE